jgi:class 3 adenylate cyclase
MSRAQDVSPADHVAFLMTDIEGSTRLWEADPAAMQSALGRHDAILDAEVERMGGRLLTHRGEGDSAFAVFSDPGAAIACAVAVQRAFAAEEWPTSSPIRVRIGLHVGNALGRDAEFVQPAVNRCARLRDLASGGQILASGDCVRAVGERPAGGETFEHLGDHSFRGLDSPIAVFQVCHAGIGRDFPSVAQRLVRPTHNIPAETTTFVGRERDAEQLSEIIAAATSRQARGTPVDRRGAHPRPGDERSILAHHRPVRARPRARRVRARTVRPGRVRRGDRECAPHG